jgi:hypothetical protein
MRQAGTLMSIASQYRLWQAKAAAECGDNGMCTTAVLDVSDGRVLQASSALFRHSPADITLSLRDTAGTPGARHGAAARRL